MKGMKMKPEELAEKLMGTGLTKAELRNLRWENVFMDQQCSTWASLSTVKKGRIVKTGVFDDLAVGLFDLEESLPDGKRMHMEDFVFPHLR